MRGSRRCSVWAWLAIGAMLGAEPARAVTVVKAAADASAEDEKPAPFPPEAEEKFVKFLAKLKDARRKACEELMAKKVAEVVKVTGLPPAGAAALEPAVKQAVDIGTDEGLAKIEKLFRKQLGRQADQLTEVIEQMNAQAEVYAKSSFLGSATDPAEKAVWKDALLRTLTPEQTARWQKAEEEAKIALGKEFADLLKASVDRTHEQQLRGVMTMAGQIKRTLALPEARAKELDALAKASADEAAKLWSARGERMLLAMPEPQRRIILQQGSLFFSIDDTEQPEKQSAWKDGLAKLLSDDERKTLQKVSEDKKTRRVQALGKMLLALFDERVAFTSPQRETLQPMADRLVKSESALFPQDQGENNYYDFGPQLFFTAGEKAKPQDFEGVLDPIQQQRWKIPSGETRSRSRVRVINARKAAPVAKATPAPTVEPEPEYVEQVISDFLFDKAEAERKRSISRMVLKAEDAARVASLAPEVMKRLQTAARGAAEVSLESWKTTLDQNVRASTSEATPQSIKQRLESMEDYQFSQGREDPPEKQAFWKKAVEVELTEPQRAAWKKELDARAAFREGAIAAMILAEFDRKHSLSGAQWTTLEARVVRFLDDYSTDIASMFSSSNATPWYMESYSMFIPFAGIPEAELKALLEKDQWEHWTGSTEFANVTNYWDNVRQNHEQRLKLKEK